MYSLYVKDSFYSNWLKFVKNTLECNGFSFIWMGQIVNSINGFKQSLLQRLNDQFRQNWSSDVNNSSVCMNYRIFKTVHKLENYLTELSPSLMRYYCKFRTGNTKLPFIQGRYNNIDREDRICSLCNSGIGDEYHYIFICSHFDQERNSLLNNDYLHNHNNAKMHSLFNSTTVTDTKKLARFTKLIVKYFR